MTPEEALSALGLELPEPPPAVGNYVGAVRVGNLLFVSGHGRHARSAIGMGALPFQIAVEIEGIFELKDGATQLAS